MVTKAQKQLQEDARELLRGILQPGDSLYTIVRHVSKSGMSRHISVFRVNRKGEIESIDWLVAKAGIFNRVNTLNSDGLKVTGVGMDMGFHVVYTISSVVLNDGYALKQYWL